ncbi:PTS transporter subunit EIIB [Lactobacillus sp. R2/2]|nr:PTS transporter subunit EIIB [Lactobacillus sp. R2/2]MEB3365114.1 PTS transporter subunit EIIB [Lactobacillus sp. R2/2]
MNSKNLIADLGGKDNIESISHCMTRIRIKVKNPQSVNRRQIASEKM